MQYPRRPDVTPTPYGKKSRQGLYNFFHEYKVTMPAHRADNWRMVNPEPDEVKGQPHLGNVMIRATDGVHALVENHERTGLIEIHLTNFMGAVKPQGYTPKVSIRASAPKKQKKKTTKKKKPRATVLREFFSELLADK